MRRAHGDVPKSIIPNAKIDSFSERRPGGGATAGARIGMSGHFACLRKKLCAVAPPQGARWGAKEGAAHVMHTTPP